MVVGLAVWCWLVGASAPVRGQGATWGETIVDQFLEWTGLEPDGSSPLTVRQIAGLIDELDKKLYHYGKIAVKSPDVFGQNRMTGYRADYEDQMKSQLGAFELILNSYQRRSDSAALTSATSVSAAIQPPQISNSRNVSTTTNTTTVPVPPPAVPFSSLFTNASALVGTASPDLTPTTASTLALANTGARPGIGLEPTVALDERSNYLYHLNELRRINAGDDSSDVAGYGLYLLRMPVSLLPSGDAAMGKGASVTVKVKHNVTPDLLPNTFRSVVILDTAYSLTDALNRGLFSEALLDKPSTCPTVPSVPLPAVSPAPPPAARPASARAVAAAASSANAGLPSGATGNAPLSEVLLLIGPENLKILVNAMKEDQVTWYRHDPSTISWLLAELNATYGYMRDQAHRNHPMFQPIIFEQLAQMVLERRYDKLAEYRTDWLKNLREARGSAAPCPLPIDVLAFALIVQSVYLDRQIKYDMEFLSQRKRCACGDPWALSFYDLYPTTPEDLERYNQARATFAAYVECKWPIHVYAMDPVVNQQNQLDLFSQRTQLQLALAVALASGQVNFQNATSYARRTELDLETVALNRTAIGFGAGETTFGWQFYPRIQTPPVQSNPRRIAGILLSGGPGPNYELDHRKIEPGLRECYALVVMPCFVPSVRFTSASNWFDLKPKCADQVIETTDMVRLSRKFQTARNGLARVCDTGRYRPDEVEMLADRLAQLEDMLPLKHHKVDLPFEGSLLGSEIFSSSPAGLAPRLFAWYGEPPQEGTASSIFLLGTGFTVYETHAIAGGVAIAEDSSEGKKLELFSRNVMRIEIPANARIKTVAASDADGNHRTLIDVHVATPNGISNHLLVEAVPKAVATASTRAQATVTRSLTINYTLLQKSDAAGNASVAGFVPVVVSSEPDNAEIELAWPQSGTPPASVDSTITFTNPSGGPALTALSRGLAPRQAGGTTFPLSGPVLKTFAADVVAQLGAFGLLDPRQPLPPLASNRIYLTPPSGAAQDSPASGPLVINLAYVSAIPHIVPPALLVKLQGANNTLGADPRNPSDVSIDWLGGVTNLQAHVSIDLSTTAAGVLAPIGTISFTDGPGGEIQLKAGLRVIPEAAFLAKLNALVAPLVQQGKITAKSIINARKVTITPQLDGNAPLAPIDVNNPFEIDVSQVSLKPDVPALARAAGTPALGGLVRPMRATADFDRPSQVDRAVQKTGGAGSRFAARRPVFADELPPLPPRAVAPADSGRASKPAGEPWRWSMFPRLSRAFR
jgi:hypothetical protein